MVNMPDKPWLPQLAIDFLEGYLKPDMIAFEWGSGGSTIFIAERTRKLISVEHNLNWHNKVIRLKNVEPLLREPQYKMILSSKTDPLAYYSECLGNVNLKRYATTIDKYKLFDFVLIDGRARPSCLFHAYSHIKPGGILMLDNAERKYYLKQTECLFENWEKMSISIENGAWETIIWRNKKKMNV
jgi:predicted O-methyltransferase YrrM